IKGIGVKSAQRMIIELKDKIVKGEGSQAGEIFGGAARNEIAEEASRALVMLGFSKPAVSKAVQAVLKANPSAKVEQVIKSALQMM
ncbi:MAG: Holliday junction branch migration protein RuvA, partial [Bacteroidales bacterium]|nr:Holliday junction branch migration protein RuvA [Bacteroidales bacterium]